MATNEGVRAPRDATLAELQERLTAAVERLVTGDDWRHALQFAARFRSRSFGNTLLIDAQHLDAWENGRVPNPEPSYVAGYNQWQSLGRQVIKGQPGYMIFAPVTGRFASSTPQDAESWRRLNRFEKPRPGEAMRSRMIGARPAYVWDISQTTGDPIPERPVPRLLEGEAPTGLWEGLARLVDADGYQVLRVEHEGMIGGASGLTDFAARTVSVRMSMDPAAQVKTLAHELGHLMLHGPDNPDAGRHRGLAEVEAESVALMVGAAHSLDTSSYTVPYLASWASNVPGKTPVEAVQSTAERVRSTSITILDALDTQQIGSGDPPGIDGRRIGVPAARTELTPPRPVQWAHPTGVGR